MGDHQQPWAAALAAMLFFAGCTGSDATMPSEAPGEPLTASEGSGGQSPHPLPQGPTESEWGRLEGNGAIVSPEGVKDGFVPTVITEGSNAGSIPATSTTTTTTTTTVAPPQQTGFYPNVERWRPTVTEAVTFYGGGDLDVHRFLRIMQCESSGRPDAKNPNSSASGLMQHLTRYWDDRANRAGWPGADVFDPEANIWVSAWLALAAPEGGWQHWVCN